MFVQKATGNRNTTTTQRKLELLQKELLVSSHQFTEVFTLNQLQFAAAECDSYTEIYQRIFTDILRDNYIFRYYKPSCIHTLPINNFDGEIK